MKTTDGKEYFGIGLDLTEFNRDAQSAQMQFRRIGDTAVSEGNRMDNALRKVGVTLGITFTAAKAVQFAADIATVRGEFQKLEIAFETMLGSKAKADALMAQMVQTAAITPFSLQDVAGGAKQLLAYGTAAEEVNHTLTKLGDIAAGLSIPLNDLIYLYGTTMTQGRMFTMDLRQFMGRGIPLADELSKQFGVAKSEVADLVSAGKVGAEEFNKAIMSLADGKFANLMEKQSKSITGQVSNLKDAVQVMMNDIGESSEGAINAALSGAGYLVEHYQAIGEIIGTLVVAYGSYKAAVIATSAMQQLAVDQAYAAEMAALQSILPAKQAVANADVLAAIDKGLLTKAQGENIIATRAEIAAKIDSLRVTHANIETDRLSAWESHKAALQKASVSKKLVARRETELLVAKASGDQTKIELAEKSLLEAQEQRHTTVKARKLTADQLAIATSREKAAAVELENASTAQNTAYTTANTGGTAVNVTWKNFLTKASIRATLAQLKHNMAVMANPYVIAAAAVAGLVYGIYRLITAETAAETAQNRHNKALEEAKERKESLLSTTKSLVGDITDETKTIYQQVEAWKELQKAMPEQFGKMTFSEFKAMKPEDRDKLISKGAEKQDNDNFLKQIEETGKRITNLKKEINEAYKLPNSGALIAQLEKKLSIEENGLRLLGEEKKKRAEIAEQARFEALPLKDKVTELEKQLTIYEQQRAEIEKQIPEHYRNADAMQALSGKQFEVKDGIVQLNAEWGKFDSQTWMNISGVNFLQGKINETKGMLDGLTGGGNDYFTSKKKAGEDWKIAQKALADIKRKGGSVSDYTKAVEDEKTAKEAFEKLGGITTLPKKSGQAGKTPKDYTDQLEQQRTAIERANKDLEFQVTQSRIDAKKDGLAKTLAQNALNFEREKEDLKRQGEERLKQIQENEKLIWESKGKKGKLNLTAQLPEADKVNFANLLDNAKTKQTNADLKATLDAQKALADITRQVSDVTENAEKRKQSAIKETYKDIKKQLEIMLETGGITREQYDNLIPKIDAAENKAQLEQLLEGVNDYQTQLDKINETWNEKIRFDAENNGGKLAETLQKGQAEAVGALNAEMLTKSEDWQQLFGNLESLSVKSLLALKEKIQKAMKDMKLDPANMKAITDALDKVDKQVSTKNPFKGLSEAIGKYKNASDEVAKSDAMASISSNVGALGQMAQSIFGDVVGGLQALGVEMDEETEKMLAGIGEMIGGATQLAQGIMTGNPVDIVAGGVKLLTSAINVFDSTSRKANRTIRANEAELENLEKQYKRLERTVNETYGSDKKEHIEQLKRVKEKQQELIRLNIEAEKSKKKPDKKKIAAWENEITELGYQIEDLGEQAKDSIFGNDIKSAIDDFANAYADAWAKGNDKAKSAKDFVKNMIKGMIMEAMKGDIAKVMPALRSQLESFWADGVISPEEELELQRRAEDINKGLDSKYKWADRFMKEGQEQGAASYGAFEKITQDQASGIDGRLTGIQMSGIERNTLLGSIDKRVFDITVNFSEMKNTLIDIWSEAAAIRKNTALLNETNELLRKVQKGTDSLISR